MAGEDEDDVRRTAVADFLIASKAVIDANKDEKLSPVQVVLLQYLALQKPGATPGEIGAEYHMESAHCAKVLKVLRDGGYVIPIADEKDGRVKHYYDTLKGAEVASAALARRGFQVPAKDLHHVKVSKPKFQGS